MSDRLDQLLNDIREQTGVCVRTKPAAEDDKRIEVNYLGVKRELYLSGGAEVCALVRYLVENGAAQGFERKEFLRSVLLGEGGDWNAFRFMTKFSVSDAPCYAMDVVPERKLGEVTAHIAQCLDGGDMCVPMDDKRIAVVRFSAPGQSAYEFGQFLSRSVYEEIGVQANVGIGMEVKSFSEIAASYQQAATASRLSELFQEKGDVHSYREYLLVRMIEDVPKPKLNEYLKQFRIGGAAEIFEDEETASTAEEFLENSLNVSETARNLFVHRNTLNYRLDKIERTTGLNIRKFSDAVTFRIISILYRLLQT